MSKKPLLIRIKIYPALPGDLYDFLANLDSNDRLAIYRAAQSLLVKGYEAYLNEQKPLSPSSSRDDSFPMKDGENRTVQPGRSGSQLRRRREIGQEKGAAANVGDGAPSDSAAKPNVGQAPKTDPTPAASSAEPPAATPTPAQTTSATTQAEPGELPGHAIARELMRSGALLIYRG